MADGIRVVALTRDYVYRARNGTPILLHTGDTLAGGVVSSFPASKDYAVVRHGIRVWFRRELVETELKREDGLFEELFT